MACVGAKRGIHHHRVEWFVHAVHIRENPFDFDLRVFGIATSDFNGLRIDVDAKDVDGSRQSRGNREDPIPAAQVYHGATCDIAAPVGEVDHLRGDPGRRRILFRRWRRSTHRLQRL